MQITDTSIPGVKLVDAQPIADDRGFFVRVLSADVFAAAGIDTSQFVQENQSRSRRPTLRGLHVRAPGEGKTVRCARGEVFYVVVDLRPRSPMFGRWESFTLDDRRHVQVYLPPGCANGFQALSDEVDICYRHDRFYEPGVDRAIAWDDPHFAIPWPLDQPLLSDRDRAAPRFGDVQGELEEWFGEIAVATGPVRP